MGLLDDLSESESWKTPLPDPEPMDPAHPYDPHEETAEQREGRVRALRDAHRLWALVQAEMARTR